MISFASYSWWSGTPTGAGVWGGIILVALIFLAFEIWMLVDVIQNKKIPMAHKVWWVVGMFLIHPLVAIAYYIATRWTNAYKK